MTHCRECNSEIADAEAFCPFCGIALEPISVGEDQKEEEVELDETTADCLLDLTGF